MSALGSLRVVELGELVAAPYCAKLLADLGADVIKVEPPGGDPARTHGPGVEGLEEGEPSPLFRYLSTNKRCLRLDLESESGGRALADLLAGADVLVDDGSAQPVAGLDLSWEALRRRYPRLVVTAIRPYGLSGPRSGTPADELTLVHAGGLGNLLPSRSENVDRAPVKLGGEQIGYQGGIAAALATVAAVRRQRRCGQGALVEIALQEVALSLVAPLVAGNRYQKTTWCRVPDRPPAMGRMQTADGYVILNAFDDHHFKALRQIMGNPEWCAGEDWERLEYRANHLMEIAPLLDAWMSRQRKEEIHQRVGHAGIPVGPINSMAAVLDNAQYRSRSFFVSVPDGRHGDRLYPGVPYRLSRTPARPDRRWRELSADAVADGTPWSSSRSENLEAPLPGGRDGGRADLPLAGVRVMELCWVWAGPYAGHLLAMLGADVIKVESHKRLDLMRRSVVWPLPEARPRSLPPSQGIAFNSVNMSKRAITLDLSRPEGVEVALRLAESSDAVIDNMRPGALDKLGLGYQALRARKPDLVVASSSGRGLGGPETEFLGYAMIHQGIGGGAFLNGYPDDHPCHSGGDVDIMNAITFAFSIVAALLHRDDSGEGQFVDYSQCEGVTALLGEYVLAYQATGEEPQRMGNRHPTHAPHGVFRAWGVDRWLAISVHDDAEFGRLCEVLGRPELLGDERSATAAARKRNEDWLEGEIEAWTRQRDRDWCVERLAAAGVRAAPSREARDLYADPHLAARGAFQTVRHPELGDLRLVGPPFRIHGAERAATCAPALGEHTETVLREIGLDEGEIGSLRAAGVIL